MLRCLTIFVTLALAVPDASAADAQNLFKTGGGVGAVKCPEFLNVMADARQRGGVATVGGVNAVTAYLHYVLGFQTGFNAEAEGVYDIFAGLGDNAGIKALYAIEPWCASNPDKNFSLAVST
jgi:hypothetical protein